MSPRTRRVLLAVVLLLLALIALALARCTSPNPGPAEEGAALDPPASTAGEAPADGEAPTVESLQPAHVQVPEQVLTGSLFQASWTGPDNPGDYLTVVRPDDTAGEYGNYRETRHGATLELAAPMEAGEWEVRYVTARSRTVLGRSPLSVTAAAAVLMAPEEVVLGAPVPITWNGPNNRADFICIVPAGAPDSQVGNYADAAKGSPLTVTAPVHPGEAEIRYVSGQGRKVLARRRLTVRAPDTWVSAPASVVAGAAFPVTWKGPANAGDYITIVPRGTPDGQYRNYNDTAKGSPLELRAPMETGEAEIRYMTGSQARVLARASIKVLPAAVSLEADQSAVAGARVKIRWTGPDNPNDYLTIVPQATPDGQYGNYTNTAQGSPLEVTAPIREGAAEIRYMSGQGARVLARRAISIAAAEVALKAPAMATAGSVLDVEWRGPNNAADYITIVPQTARDGTALQMMPTSRGSPARLTAPKEPATYEVRYMSGQGNVVLARARIEVR